jgi:hypothetical protein
MERGRQATPFDQMGVGQTTHIPFFFFLILYIYKYFYYGNTYYNLIVDDITFNGCCKES